MLAQDPDVADLARAAVTGLVLVIGGLALAPLAVALARRMFPGRNLFFARWGFSHVVLVALVFLFVLLAASPLLGAVYGTAELPMLAQLGAMAAAEVGAGIAIVSFARRLDPSGWRCLGLWPGGHLRAMLVGIVSYLLALPGILGLMLVWPFLLERLEVAHGPQEVLVGVLGTRGPALALTILLAVLVVPFLEELVFRGFLQPLLVQNLGDRGGVAATSVLFAALHGASAFLPIFGLSLVLGLVMLRTQRLSAPWLVHAVHNGSTLALLFLVPEMRETLGPEPAWFAQAFHP